MTLAELIDASSPVQDICDWLDGLDPDRRAAEAASLNRNAQRALWQLLADAPPITAHDLVPADVPDLTEVIHDGQNTLPLPPSQRRFQKRFCRPDDGSRRLFGYNEAPSRWLIGPGYFVAIPTNHNTEWSPLGAWVVDYFQVPDDAVVESWPKVKQNHQGLQVLVYHRTRDFMRKVSTHVSIGAAYKSDKALDHYFTLCRRPHTEP